MSTRPIGSYALISDCHSAALVGDDGSIDWLCFPRFDRPSVFARLLDEAAGHWSIRPTEVTSSSRRYVDRSMVLETTFRTPTGALTLVDAMSMGEGVREHELGHDSPHVVVRRLTCTEGTVQVDIEYTPRPEYGLIYPILTAADGVVSARGGADALTLECPVRLELRDSTARGRISMQGGESVAFALHDRRSWEAPSTPWGQEGIARQLDDTIAAWQSWSDLHQAYEGPWRDLVHQSGRVLQALQYSPTGAIVAAPTTSLPEEVGGERNWDYRYAWVRDASLTLEALWVSACPDEASDFFSYLASAASTQLSRGVDLQIMFGIGGEHDLSERTLPHLSGWGDSRPVRVGNGAWDQRQLDVYGELLNSAYRLSEQWDELDPATNSFLADAANAAAARWDQTDQGIWEIRGEPRQFLYSKLMCWVALDRAIELADRIGAEDRVDGWAKTREEIRDAILQRGWNESAQAFTQSFGSEDLDASNLMMPIVGFLPAKDPRMLATINFPQAFSHIGLVNAAWAISQAEQGLSPGGGPL